MFMILVPEGEDGLRAMLGEAHRRYARAINSAKAGAVTSFGGAS